MLEALLRDLRGPHPNWQRAALRAFHLALATLALPGLPLGLIYALTHPAPLALNGGLGLCVLAVLLGAVALRLARTPDPTQKPEEALLSRAIQLASAPAAAFLLGCAALSQWQAAGALWLIALGFYGFCRAQLARIAPTVPQQP